jgi:hypothetical protein
MRMISSLQSTKWVTIVNVMSRRRLKSDSHDLLARQLDLPALQEALGALPSWLAGIGGATEQVAWLNTLLAQVGGGGVSTAWLCCDWLQ